MWTSFGPTQGVQIGWVCLFNGLFNILKTCFGTACNVHIAADVLNLGIHKGGGEESCTLFQKHTALIK